MDKVGDLLIRIKNSYLATKQEVAAPFSKLSMAICELLKIEGFIEGYKAEGREIKITLRYDLRRPAMTGIIRVSKPGKRVYKGRSQIKKVYNGLGIAIISTPKGIMSDGQARKEGVGGEVMAYVW